MKSVDNTPCHLRHDIVLVDEGDQQIDTTDKLTAHQKGLLHRAFSVFIFRDHLGETQLLLQQRHCDKYHAGGLWSNTCCSHPKPHEEVIAAGERRLQEEMGFCVALQSVGHFIYKAHFDNGLTEYEFDHVLVGHFDGDIQQFNRTEVSDVQWCSIVHLKDQLQRHPDNYTPWFARALDIALKY